MLLTKRWRRMGAEKYDIMMNYKSAPVSFKTYGGKYNEH